MKNFELNLNSWALLGSTIITLLTTWYWFGPLFGEKLNSSQQKFRSQSQSKKGFAKFPVMFLQHIVINIALAIFMKTLGIKNIPDLLSCSFYIWFGFIAMLLLDNLVWGQSNKLRFAINTSHRFVNIILGALVYHLLAN